MDQFDLNLLRIFDALRRHGHLGRAAEELRLSQPAISHSLKKLRAQMGDVLFIKAYNGMRPSPKAEQLAPTIRALLAAVGDSILSVPAFDPATSRRTFSIAMSDVGEMVFLPRLLNTIMEQAPSINISSVSIPPRDMLAAMQRGQVDLAVGYFPDLNGSDIFQQRLFRHGFVCLASRGNSVVRGRLSQQQFRELPHAVVHSEGRSQEIVEQYLKKEGIVRRKVLTCPHFLSIPMVISSTDMIVTVPDPVGDAFAMVSGLQILKPPFAFPEFDLKQNWHRCQHDDAGNQWLRTVVVQLFNH